MCTNTNAIIYLGRAYSILLVIISIEHSFWIGNVDIYIVFRTILRIKENKLGQFNHLSHPQRVFLITKNEEPAPLHEEKGRETLNEHKTPTG